MPSSFGQKAHIRDATYETSRKRRGSEMRSRRRSSISCLLLGTCMNFYRAQASKEIWDTRKLRFTNSGHKLMPRRRTFIAMKNQDLPKEVAAALCIDEKLVVLRDLLGLCGEVASCLACSRHETRMFAGSESQGTTTTTGLVRC